MKEARHIFVYGTLRQGSEIPESQILKDKARYMGDAFSQAKLYRINTYPGMVISQDEESRVKGELYLTEETGLLNELDRYEECSDEFPLPHEYTREIITVTTHEGKEITAWAYIYNLSVENLQLIETGDWME